MNTTKLYVSTEFMDAIELELLSVSLESQRHDVTWINNEPLYTYRDAGVLVAKIRGQAMLLVGLFDQRTLGKWMIEMPNHMTFMFDGYVESIDQSLGLFEDVSSEIKVRIAGPVKSYYDGPAGAPDTTDVFNKKASKAQAKTMAEVLRKVLEAPTAMSYAANLSSVRGCPAPNQSEGWEAFEEFD